MPQTVMATRVRYHGSLTEHHGEYRVLGPCDCDDCAQQFSCAWDNYHRRGGTGPKPEPGGFLELTNGVRNLYHVRLSSVTALD